MIKIKYKNLKSIALILLALQSAVFFVGWLKIFVAIPAIILLGIAIFLSHRDNDERFIEINKSTLVIIALLVVAWAILSGQGGFFTQKPDYNYRNAIFRDLIFYDWPVRYSVGNDESMVYYVGYWMLPALVGKIGNLIGGASLGWLFGRVAVLVWSAVLALAAVLLFMFNVGAKGKKAIWLSFAIFVFFSGMDALGAIFHPELFSRHLEWWAGCFQYSSMSTQLCWVYNQAVPAWIATALFINEKSAKNYALIGLLILSTSPLPLIGLVALMLAFAFRYFVSAIKNKKVVDFVKSVLSPQNILALISIVPIYMLYYMNNTASFGDSSASTSHFVDFTSKNIFSYCLFIVFEFLVTLLIVANKKTRFESVLIAVLLAVIPFIRMGEEYDFCMRASIPALFLLMVLVTKALLSGKDYEKNSKPYLKWQKKAFILSCVLIIGVTTPMVEYISSASSYISSRGAVVEKYDKMGSLANIGIEKKHNFVCENSSESAFYKYIAKN